MVSGSQPVNCQQHGQHSSMPESSIYAEPVPSTYVDHRALINGALFEDPARIEQPMVDSCQVHTGGEEKNRDQPYLDFHECSCMICNFLGTEFIPPESGLPSYDREYSVVCRFPGCQVQLACSGMFFGTLGLDVAKHERSHFGKVGDYHCLEEGCRAITKKFADLKRHYLVRHCTNATKFPCPIFGCKYGGDNGFTRQDKLKSHHRNVHQGKVAPGKAFQPLKPKMGGAKVIKGKPQSAHLLQPKPNVGA